VLAPIVVDSGLRATTRRAPRHIFKRRKLASLRWVGDELLDRLSAVLGDGDYDVVQLEHTLLAPCLERIPPKSRSVLSLHNVSTYQHLSMAKAAKSARTRAMLLAEAWLQRQIESSYVPRFDQVVVVSEDERRLVRRLAPNASVTVVPQGVDLVTRRPLPDDGVPGTLLFVGNLEYPPNADAVVEFCRQTLPLVRERIPEVNLVVVGPGAPREVRALNSDKVEIVGRVERLEPSYARSQVVVVPLRAGGGSRLKVLEAMAFGRCVVSTPFGVTGLAVIDGREVLLGEPGASLARQLERALLDSPLRCQVAERGRRFVEREHSWDASAERLLAAYSTIGGPR
jgi:glycosyltransferase involved in cell wall biosynthesis